MTLQSTERDTEKERQTDRKRERHRERERERERENPRGMSRGAGDTQSNRVAWKARKLGSDITALFSLVIREGE